MKKDIYIKLNWASLVTQLVKNLPTMRDTWVLSLGWEDPQEEGMATHSNILPGESPWTEEPEEGAIAHEGLKELDTTKHSTELNHFAVHQKLT